jgi:sulfofructose kinase
MKRVLCVGHAVQDFVFSVSTLPTAAQKYRANRFASSGGGPAATAAVTVVRLGGAATLACRIGADPVATTILDELRRFGVDCTHVRRIAGRSSSLSAIVVDERGERMIVNYADPQMPVAADWLDAIDFADFDAVLGDSRWPEGSAAALRRARTLGKPAILDADSPMNSQQALAIGATHVAFSEPGLREFTGETDANTALKIAQQRTGNWCCVTLGGRGVSYYDGHELHHETALTVTARDTAGAGDVWHGAFALALAEGADEQQAVRAASAAAACKVQRIGGRAVIPTRAERDRLLGIT